MGAHRPPKGQSPDGRPSDPAGGRFGGARGAAPEPPDAPKTARRARPGTANGGNLSEHKPGLSRRAQSQPGLLQVGATGIVTVTRS